MVEGASLPNFKPSNKLPVCKAKLIAIKARHGGGIHEESHSTSPHGKVDSKSATSPRPQPRWPSSWMNTANCYSRQKTRVNTRNNVGLNRDEVVWEKVRSRKQHGIRMLGQESPSAAAEGENVSCHMTLPPLALPPEFHSLTLN